MIQKRVVICFWYENYSKRGILRKFKSIFVFWDNLGHDFKEAEISAWYQISIKQVLLMNF